MSDQASPNRVIVFGGTGYLGRYIVHQLAQNGFRVRVAVRHPQSELFQEFDGAVEQVQADVTDSQSITRCAPQKTHLSYSDGFISR